MNEQATLAGLMRVVSALAEIINFISVVFTHNCLFCEPDNRSCLVRSDSASFSVLSQQNKQKQARSIELACASLCDFVSAEQVIYCG
jgi:hypothetical protein